MAFTHGNTFDMAQVEMKIFDNVRHVDVLDTADRASKVSRCFDGLDIGNISGIRDVDELRTARAQLASVVQDAKDYYAIAIVLFTIHKFPKNRLSVIGQHITKVESGIKHHGCRVPAVLMEQMRALALPLKKPA